MDTIWSFSGDRLYGSAETLDLRPQWRQALHVVVQINHGHLSAWMHLWGRDEWDTSAEDLYSLTTDDHVKLKQKYWKIFLYRKMH